MMLTEEQLKNDLDALKKIALKHKSAGSEFETKKTIINGLELDAFCRIPNNLYEVYRLSLEDSHTTFLVYQDERYSFGETFDAASRMGRVLIEQYRVRKGDRVGICARNSAEWCIAYMAATIVGAIVVPMNSWWQGRELEFGVVDSGCKTIFIDPPRRSQLAPYIEKLGLSLIDIKPERQDASSSEFFSLIKDAVPLSEAEIRNFNVMPEDDASIMYTSGSTGNPKGVLSTHRNITNALYTWKYVKEINEILRPELVEENPQYQDSILANVPLFHCTGSHAQFLLSIIYKRKFVMMYKWEADEALRLIEKERITVFHGVPTMTWELMQSKNFNTTDLKSLRGVSGGGAARPPEHLNMMLNRFPKEAVPGLGYGLTETNAIGAIISGKFYQTRPNSTGRPTPPVTSIQIFDQLGNSLPTGQIGEVGIKGPTVMKGYWKNPVATEEVIRNGWFITGDIGMLDKTGFLIILDRAKDIVIRGGENIGCAEVEYAFHEHSAVSEVSVYGVPDERLGEALCATVMIRPGEDVDEKILKEFLGNRIAAFKVPEKIFFQHEQLPRGSTGKIAKKQIRTQTIEKLQA